MPDCTHIKARERKREWGRGMGHRGMRSFFCLFVSVWCERERKARERFEKRDVLYLLILFPRFLRWFLLSLFLGYPFTGTEERRERARCGNELPLSVLEEVERKKIDHGVTQEVTKTLFSSFSCSFFSPSFLLPRWPRRPSHLPAAASRREPAAGVARHSPLRARRRRAPSPSLTNLAAALVPSPSVLGEGSRSCRLGKS